jgi:hypothetical protein
LPSTKSVTAAMIASRMHNACSPERARRQAADHRRERQFEQVRERQEQRPR